MRSFEKGNALFLVLIAVALFAALSYAVTNSGRGGSGVDKEKTQLAVADMVTYINSIQNAIQRLKLINGCSDTEISFHYDSDADGTLETDGSDNYYNSSSPTDFSCHVFHSDGGGLFYKAPEEILLDTSLSASPYYGEAIFTQTRLGSSATARYMGTIAYDLLFYLPYVSDTVCDMFISALDAHPKFVEDSTMATTPPYFTGSYGMSGNINHGTHDGNLFGGCVAGATPFTVGENVIYFPILLR